MTRSLDLDHLQQELAQLRQQTIQLKSQLRDRETRISCLQQERDHLQKCVAQPQISHRETHPPFVPDLIFQTLPDLLLWMDSQGTILGWRSGLHPSHYFSSGVSLDESIFGLLPIEARAQVQEAIADVQRSRSWASLEYSLPLPAGSQTYEARLLSLRTNQLIMMIRNISDRKQMETTLRESEQYNHDLFEQAPIGLAVCDLQGRLAYVNPAYAEILGRTVEETLSLSYWDITPENYMEEEQAIVERLHQTGRYGPYEKEYIHKDGYLIPVRLSGSIIQKGEELLIWSSVEDISDRKQVECALRESEQYNRRLFEQSSIGLALCDLNGKLVYVNPAYATILGRTVEETLTLNYWDITPQKYAEQEQIIVSEPLRHTGRYGPYEKEYIHKDGHLIPVRLSGSIIHKNGANFIWSSVEDISDRKQIEDALRESEIQLREKAEREQLLNQIASQIRSSLDLDEILETAVHAIRGLLHLDRCLFVWHRATADSPYWEVVHESVSTGVPGGVGLQMPDRIIPTLTQRGMRREITQLDDVELEPDAVTRQFMRDLGYRAVIMLPVHTQLGAVGVLDCSQMDYPRRWEADEVDLLQAVADQLAIAIDQAELYKQSRQRTQQIEEALTELQRTQSKLVQSEKMSSLGQLVAGVAHEINNPVNFIYGNLNHANSYIHDLLELVTLYQNHYPNPIDEVAEQIEKIDLDFLIDDLPKLLSSMKMGANRIQKIVLSLRNFSRMDEAEVKSVDIHEGINNTLMILHNRLKERCDRPSIEITKQYGDLPPIECYAGQLNQVFMNILSNAIDALEDSLFLEPSSTKNPMIQIRTELVNRDRVTIRIIDNGPGIPEAVQKRIFEPFYTTKPIGKGTGLGLSISYQVVEKHGGNLLCLSAPGAGTEFVIDLPILNLTDSRLAHPVRE